MTRKMDGFIEPYTLGFLLGFIGAGLTLFEQSQDAPPEPEPHAVSLSTHSTQTQLEEHEYVR